MRCRIGEVRRLDAICTSIASVPLRRLSDTTADASAGRKSTAGTQGSNLCNGADCIVLI